MVNPKMIHNAMVNIQKAADQYVKKTPLFSMAHISAVAALILDVLIAYITPMSPL
jgi:hypothetical protein